MNFEEYRDLYIEALHLDEDFEVVNLPIEMLPGEAVEDAMIRFLLEKNLIEVDDSMFRIPDRSKVEAFSPSLMKLLDAVMMASALSELDSLEEKGLVYMTADEDGNIVYELTELGRKELK